MTDKPSVPNPFGTLFVIVLFVVLPTVALSLGGDYPIQVMFVVLPVGTLLLLFRREWWWVPIREYVRVDSGD